VTKPSEDFERCVQNAVKHMILKGLDAKNRAFLLVVHSVFD